MCWFEFEFEEGILRREKKMGKNDKDRYTKSKEQKCDTQCLINNSTGMGRLFKPVLLELPALRVLSPEPDMLLSME